MTKSIEIIRQSITKVTQMLSGMSVTVTQRGDQAFVKYDKRTGKPVRVNIPFLPDGATEQLIAAVQGFLDHEVAHVLFTDPKARSEACEESKSLDKMHNIVEDCFIERMMELRFKGSGINLSNTRKLVFDTRQRPGIDQLISKGMTDELVMFKALSTTIFRALAGHVECKDFMDDGDKWQYLPNVLKAVGFFEHEVQKCQNSFDTLELARKTLKALRNMHEDEDDQDSDKGDDDDQDDRDDGDECEDEGSGKKSKKKESDGDGDGDDDGSDEGDDKSSSTDDDESEESEADGDESNDSDGGDDEGSDNQDGDQNGEGEDEGSESSDGDGDEESEGGESSSGTGEKDQSKSDKKESMTQEESEMFLEAVEDAKDFESEMTQEITQVYQDMSATGKLGSWIIFSREYDVPVPYDATGVSSQAVTEMTDEVNSMVGPMAKQLERLILARKKSLFEPGKKSGRLHSANLHRLQTGDDRIFRRKFETRLKNTAVEILTDMSGSMSGGKMRTAAFSSFALAQMLQRVNIPCEVMTFTTSEGPPDFVKERREAEMRLGRLFSHQGVCRHLLMKGFNERIDSRITKRFAHLGSENARRFMSANCDPESVYTAAMRLAKRPEERKILMVLSDGHPAFNGDYSAGFTQLKETVKTVEAAGLDVLGIGIQDDSVRQFYSKAVVIHRATDLPATIMGEMQGLLLR